MFFDNDIDSQIQSFLDMPIKEDNNTFTRIAQICMFHVWSYYYEDVMQLELTHYADERYEKKITTLISSLNALRIQKQKSVMVNSEPEDERSICDR